ncbi:hypothetical protein K504DRAFT_503292 [Pleomassaria siparia CBS 279.74]|uniref:Uncharacterized protein n=1 Tax=Pleomassaria siparia CBS 279.74 TaxID=1314801 RepID=A0A6G1K657_9PLEO|nr:hypothetical protein K504DRAFT_503292 [Pleomassaria siparia CBS 279.74]
MEFLLAYIEPNPASALNEAARKLASEDWDGCCRRTELQLHRSLVAAQLSARNVYDKDFMLQTRAVFKEKPSTDWDMKLKEVDCWRFHRLGHEAQGSRLFGDSTDWDMKLNESDCWRLYRLCPWF